MHNNYTREEAFAACPSGSYVENYAGRWIIVPLEPVVQPAFFSVTPGKLGGAL